MKAVGQLAFLVVGDYNSAFKRTFVQWKSAATAPKMNAAHGAMGEVQFGMAQAAGS
jgi:hypothetical protein